MERSGQRARSERVVPSTSPCREEKDAQIAERVFVLKTIQVFVESHSNHAEGSRKWKRECSGEVFFVGLFVGVSFGAFLIAILFAKLDAMRANKSFLVWRAPDNPSKIPQDVLNN